MACRLSRIAIGSPRSHRLFLSVDVAGNRPPPLSITIKARRGRDVAGGDFTSGFLGSAFGALAGVPQVNDIYDRGILRTIVGGIAAEIGGGKFSNGALTAAYGYLFSEASRASSGSPGREPTTDEVNAAKSVFGDRIDYSRVRIVDGKYVFFQGSGYAMSPNGNVYWPGECGNLATCGGADTASVFIHEMTHVMQYQNGVNVLGQGFLLQAGKFLSFGLYDPYSFTYDPSRAFSSYNIEQQGRLAQGIYSGIYPNNIDY